VNSILAACPVRGVPVEVTSLTGRDVNCEYVSFAVNICSRRYRIEKNITLFICVFIFV
jgi:hypothetical protein